MASSGVVNLLGKREAKDDDLETKLILKKHKNKSEETTKGFAEIKGRVELFETKSDQAPPKAVPSRQKTLYVTCLSPKLKYQICIAYITRFGKGFN